MVYQTLVFFRVDLRVVDDVLQRLTASGGLALPVIVCSTDINLLGALELSWRNELSLSPVVVPPTDQGIGESLEMVFESEQVELQSVLWVSGTSARDLGLPTQVGRWIAAESADTIGADLVQLIEPD